LSVFNRENDEGVSRGAKALVALPDRAGDNPRSAEARLDEAAGLAAAIGVDVVEQMAFRVRDPKPATLFGSGQVDQIAGQTAHLLGAGPVGAWRVVGRRRRRGLRSDRSGASSTQA